MDREAVLQRLEKSRESRKAEFDEASRLGEKWAEERAEFGCLERMVPLWRESATGMLPPIGERFGYDEMAARLSGGNMTGREFWTIEAGLPFNDPRPRCAEWRTVFFNSAVSVFIPIQEGRKS